MGRRDRGCSQSNFRKWLIIWRWKNSCWEISEGIGGPYSFPVWCTLHHSPLAHPNPCSPCQGLGRIEGFWMFVESWPQNSETLLHREVSFCDKAWDQCRRIFVKASGSFWSSSAWIMTEKQLLPAVSLDRRNIKWQPVQWMKEQDPLPFFTHLNVCTMLKRGSNLPPTPRKKIRLKVGSSIKFKLQKKMLNIVPKNHIAKSYLIHKNYKTTEKYKVI